MVPTKTHLLVTVQVHAWALTEATTECLVTALALLNAAVLIVGA